MTWNDGSNPSFKEKSETHFGHRHLYTLVLLKFKVCIFSILILLKINFLINGQTIVWFPAKVYF